LVPDTEFTREVGRHFPVIEPFDGERHTWFLLGSRRDRIAALRLVTIFSRESHINMLSRSMPIPVRDGKRDALRPRCFYLCRNDLAELPA
jgi:hypothetical protein